MAGIFGIGGDHKPLPTDQQHRVEFHASTTAKTAIDISCVAAAVAAREATLDSAVSTQSVAVNSAYTDRASALASAYAQSGNDTIRKAVKTAWTNFAAAIRVAHKNWNSSQQSAWQTFRVALKACGTNATAVSDSGNASLDASGN